MSKIKRAIPDLFTLANLVMGCQAVVFAFQHNYHSAAICIGFAAVFDFFDGFVARLLKVGGEFGKQLDSLADAITFGLAPGMMMFNLLQEILQMNSIVQPSSAGVVVIFPYTAWLIPVFSVLRLAKFNVDTRQSDSFIGLPTPANAAFFAFIGFICQNSYGLFTEEFLFLLDIKILVPFLIFMSLLMVSEVPMFSLKFKDFSFSKNRIRYVFLVTALAIFLAFGAVAVPISVLLYILISLVTRIFRLV
jgi:CDP-diacylglycerol---serine O-phosphatidyltransferase